MVVLCRGAKLFAHMRYGNRDIGAVSELPRLLREDQIQQYPKQTVLIV